MVGDVHRRCAREAVAQVGARGGSGDHERVVQPEARDELALYVHALGILLAEDELDDALLARLLKQADDLRA